jgi:hypothetical protein
MQKLAFVQWRRQGTEVSLPQLGSTFLSLSEKTFMKIFVELSTTFLIDVKN